MSDVKPSVVQLAQDVEYAKARQSAMRKEAPRGVKVGKVWKSPRDRKVELYCPECLDDKQSGRKATHTAFYGDPDNHRAALDEGYMPVIDKGEQVRAGRDLLYTRPIEFQRAMIDDAQRRSNERMYAAVDKESKETSDVLQNPTVDVEQVALK